MRSCDKRALFRYVLFYERYPEVLGLLSGEVRDACLAVCRNLDPERYTLIEGIVGTVYPKFKFTLQLGLSALA